MLNLGRRLAAAAPALIRRLSTEAKAAPPADRLYRRLSALGANAGMVSSTINEYIREGKTVTKPELERCVTELRKYKRHRNALEVRRFLCVCDSGVLLRFRFVSLLMVENGSDVDVRLRIG